MSSRFSRLRAVLRRIALVSLILCIAAWIAWMLLPKPELYPPGMAFSAQVFDRDGRLLHLAITPDGKYRIPARFDAIGGSMIRATLEMEDRAFYSHIGVDFKAVVRAAWGGISGQRLGGGSTLTMQYARLRWDLKTRSASGKLEQMFRAIQIERHYGKREILEAYFTLAPYGGNVEGIEAAARIWCEKPSAELSLREAAALTVVPQSPAARSPRNNGNSARSAYARLMARLTGESDALGTEFRLGPGSIPRMIPHLARRLAPTAVAKTSIEFNRPVVLEQSIADFLDRWHSRGLRNAAAILVHAPTREVRACVGSARFLDGRIQGQVDGLVARRSPGSALKPFVYALALEQGLVHPRTLLDDMPRRFGTYNPENSDRGFLGPVGAAEALRRSRNVPAVDLAARLASPGLDGFLRSAGVQLEKPPGDYGLSIALGGGEVTLEELARLYSMLASDGESRPLSYAGEIQQAPYEGPGLSVAARALTLDALRDAGPAGVPTGLSWKTGTSHGFRDAWACGVQGDWVLCVWLGHFDGKPMPGLFARDTAAPLLFQTVQRLGLRARNPVRPPEIVDAMVCVDSGCIAGLHCPNRTRCAFIAGVSPIVECDVHRSVDGVVREFWPAHRLEQFRRSGFPRGGAPVAQGGAPPRIVSPVPALTYVVRAADASGNAIPLEAEAGAGARQIHWFEGRRFLGMSEPARPLLWRPAPGRWTLQAIDDAGRTAQVTIQVSAER